MEHIIKGMVEYNIFKNEQSGFGIYTLVLFNSNQKPLTITGPIAELEVDTYYELTGKYVENQKYGMQFQVDTFSRMLPVQKDFVVRYLSGPNFPGIGSITAARIVEQYGEDVLEKVKDGEITEIEVKGLTKTKAVKIIEIIMNDNEEDGVVNFLMAHGLNNKQIVKINQMYGFSAVDVLKENPYRLVFDIDGIGFKTADKIAMGLNFDMEHVYRKQALYLDQYKQVVFGKGDSFLLVNPESLEPEVHDLLEEGELVLDDNRLYHHTQYESETFVTEFITEFEYMDDLFKLDDMEEKISEVEKKLNIHFDDIQSQAIQSFFDRDMMILTGGPGTGKSTLLSGIVSLMQSEFPRLNIAMCAPTGRAAKRLESLTNVQASTIHSMLKWDLESNEFGVNEDTPLECDVLIVDEFSMVDLWLFNHLLKASWKVKKFLFVGDQDQLPSVGPGFVLGDLIASEKLPVITLERNYRQEAGSEVIDLAMNFKEGNIDIHQYHKDVSFFDTRFNDLKEIVLDKVKTALNQGYHINDIQVLAPKYAGSAGIDNLNHFLQKMCNPKEAYKPEIQHGTRIFREGDKILQLKNQPDDFVFNGDIGYLVEVEEKQLLVDFDGILVAYGPQDFINITHAYAMSVHKAQGSEYPVVILIAVNEFNRMLSRRLYYTAATRSSKRLILVGLESAFKTAARRSEESKRETYLKERLELS